MQLKQGQSCVISARNLLSLSMNGRNRPPSVHEHYGGWQCIALETFAWLKIHSSPTPTHKHEIVLHHPSNSFAIQTPLFIESLITSLLTYICMCLTYVIFNLQHSLSCLGVELLSLDVSCRQHQGKLRKVILIYRQRSGMYKYQLSLYLFRTLGAANTSTCLTGS